MPKLLVLLHGILVYTRIFVHIFWIPEGKYVNDLFSDVQVLRINLQDNQDSRRLKK